MDRFSYADLKFILFKISDFFYLKTFVASVFVALSWAFNGKTEILIVIYSLVVIDTITALWAVLKNQGWRGLSSRKSFRGAEKFIVYLVFLYVTRMIDKTLPLTLASPVMDAFLVVTEAVSILENFNKLGYPAPVLLINRLKAIIEKKS